MSRCEVLFVGSVPLAGAPEVFTTLGTRFGRQVRRLPDGETGERLAWVAWQERVFEHHPQLEPAPAEVDWRTAGAAAPKHTIGNRPHNTQYRLRAGVRAADLHFGELGYAQVARESYADFLALKRTGTIPAGCRLMIAIPSPYNVISWNVAPDVRSVVEPAYEAAMSAEIQAIAQSVPAHELAIQWDCAHDMQAFEGARTPWFTPIREGIVERLARFGDAVPAGVELGYHFCFGTYGGRHFVEPKSARAMVDLANGITTQTKRSVEWIHMPVPIERDDDAYFAPLGDLRLRPDTLVYLGLIHDQDGAAGTAKRMATADRYLRDYGVATECGFGRRDPESLAKLLDVHADVLRSVCAHCG